MWGAQLPMIPLLAGVTPAEVRAPLNSLNCLSCSSEEQLHQLLLDASEPLGLSEQAAPSYLRYLKTVQREAESVKAKGLAEPEEAAAVQRRLPPGVMRNTQAGGKSFSNKSPPGASFDRHR
jgi:hypothetical protein